MRFFCRAFRSPAAAVVLLSVCAVAGAVRSAVAQQSDARGFITINGGLQAASAYFSDNIAFGHPLFGPEEGDFDTRYRGGGDTLLDVSGGVRIWRHLAVGAGVSQFSHEDAAGITGRIPHPFFFDRSRQISGTETGLARQTAPSHVHHVTITRPAMASTNSLFDTRNDTLSANHCARNFSGKSQVNADDFPVPCVLPWSTTIS